MPGTRLDEISTVECDDAGLIKIRAGDAMLCVYYRERPHGPVTRRDLRNRESIALEPTVELMGVYSITHA